MKKALDNRKYEGTYRPLPPGMIGINNLEANNRSARAAGKSASSSAANLLPEKSGQTEQPVKPHDPIRDV
jgi:hypothetical protein